MAGYAMTNDQSGGVLDLLEEIEPCLAPTTWVTGPIGLTDRMARCRDVDGKGPHLRMILRDDPKPVETYKVAELDHSHLGAVEDLHHSDPARHSFCRECSTTEHSSEYGTAPDFSQVLAPT